MRASVLQWFILWNALTARATGSLPRQGLGLGPPDPAVPLIREEVAWRGPHRSILSRIVSVPGSKAAEAGKTITFDVLDPSHGDGLSGYSMYYNPVLFGLCCALP
jgi:hypothetical protein